MNQVDNLIHMAMVGSEAHGLARADSDLDVRAVYVAPKSKVLSPFFTPHSPQEISGDVDFSAWELRPFVKMCASANPNSLEALFSDERCTVDLVDAHPFDAMAGITLVAARSLFLTKRIAATHAGFAKSCIRRLEHGKTRTGDRTVDVERFGYDTKYAMHAVRILGVAVRALQRGEYKIMVDEDERKLLIAIREGQFSKDWVLGQIDSRVLAAERAAQKSDLPDEPSIKNIEALVEAVSEISWQK